jgi:hypothetical protein
MKKKNGELARQGGGKNLELFFEQNNEEVGMTRKVMKSLHSTFLLRLGRIHSKIQYLFFHT